MTDSDSLAPGAARAIAGNMRFAATFDRARARRPSPRFAVVACMDARLTVEEILDLRPGEAHIIRNAGGLATDDAIRSLVVSQHLLGTCEVIVIEHTGCGMLTLDDDVARRSVIDATGVELDLSLLGFEDLERNLAAQVERIRAHPWIMDVPVTGFIYEVETGILRPALEPPR
jgi:carbonic anhydrase